MGFLYCFCGQKPQNDDCVDSACTRHPSETSGRSSKSRPTPGGHPPEAAAITPQATGEDEVQTSRQSGRLARHLLERQPSRSARTKLVQSSSFGGTVGQRWVNNPDGSYQDASGSLHHASATSTGLLFQEVKPLHDPVAAPNPSRLGTSSSALGAFATPAAAGSGGPGSSAFVSAGSSSMTFARSVSRLNALNGSGVGSRRCSLMDVDFTRASLHAALGSSFLLRGGFAGSSHSTGPWVEPWLLHSILRPTHAQLPTASQSIATSSAVTGVAGYMGANFAASAPAGSGSIAAAVAAATGAGTTGRPSLDQDAPRLSYGQVHAPAAPLSYPVQLFNRTVCERAAGLATPLVVLVLRTAGTSGTGTGRRFAVEERKMEEVSGLAAAAVDGSAANGLSTEGAGAGCSSGAHISGNHAKSFGGCGEEGDAGERLFAAGHAVATMHLDLPVPSQRARTGLATPRAQGAVPIPTTQHAAQHTDAESEAKRAHAALAAALQAAAGGEVTLFHAWHNTAASALMTTLSSHSSSGPSGSGVAGDRLTGGDASAMSGVLLSPPQNPAVDAAAGESDTSNVLWAVRELLDADPCLAMLVRDLLRQAAVRPDHVPPLTHALVPSLYGTLLGGREPYATAAAAAAAAASSRPTAILGAAALHSAVHVGHLRIHACAYHVTAAGVPLVVTDPSADAACSSWQPAIILEWPQALPQHLSAAGLPTLGPTPSFTLGGGGATALAERGHPPPPRSTISNPQLRWTYLDAEGSSSAMSGADGTPHAAGMTHAVPPVRSCSGNTVSALSGGGDGGAHAAHSPLRHAGTPPLSFGLAGTPATQGHGLTPQHAEGGAAGSPAGASGGGAGSPREAGTAALGGGANGPMGPELEPLAGAELLYVIQTWQRHHLLLASVPYTITLFDCGGRVLQQNQGSVDFMGDITAEAADAQTAGAGGAGTTEARESVASMAKAEAEAAGKVGGVAGTAAGSCGATPTGSRTSFGSASNHMLSVAEVDVLSVLFCMCPDLLDEMLEEIICGNMWRGIVQVPRLMRPVIRAAQRWGATRSGGAGGTGSGGGVTAGAAGGKGSSSGGAAAAAASATRAASRMDATAATVPSPPASATNAPASSRASPSPPPSSVAAGVAVGTASSGAGGSKGRLGVTHPHLTRAATTPLSDDSYPQASCADAGAATHPHSPSASAAAITAALQRRVMPGQLGGCERPGYPVATPQAASAAHAAAQLPPQPRQVSSTSRRPPSRSYSLRGAMQSSSRSFTLQLSSARVWPHRLAGTDGPAAAAAAAAAAASTAHGSAGGGRTLAQRLRRASYLTDAAEEEAGLPGGVMGLTAHHYSFTAAASGRGSHAASSSHAALLLRQRQLLQQQLLAEGANPTEAFTQPANNSDAGADGPDAGALTQAQDGTDVRQVGLTGGVGPGAAPPAPGKPAVQHAFAERFRTGRMGSFGGGGAGGGYPGAPRHAPRRNRSSLACVSGPDPMEESDWAPSGAERAGLETQTATEGEARAFEAAAGQGGHQEQGLPMKDAAMASRSSPAKSLTALPQHADDVTPCSPFVANGACDGIDIRGLHSTTAENADTAATCNPPRHSSTAGGDGSSEQDFRYPHSVPLIRPTVVTAESAPLDDPSFHSHASACYSASGFVADHADCRRQQHPHQQHQHHSAGAHARGGVRRQNHALKRPLSRSSTRSYLMTALPTSTLNVLGRVNSQRTFDSEESQGEDLDGGGERRLTAVGLRGGREGGRHSAASAEGVQRSSSLNVAAAEPRLTVPRIFSFMRSASRRMMMQLQKGEGAATAPSAGMGDSVVGRRHASADNFATDARRCGVSVAAMKHGDRPTTSPGLTESSHACEEGAAVRLDAGICSGLAAMDVAAVAADDAITAAGAATRVGSTSDGSAMASTIARSPPPQPASGCCLDAAAVDDSSAAAATPETTYLSATLPQINRLRGGGDGEGRHVSPRNMSPVDMARRVGLAWHEVAATSFTDPVTGTRVVALVQNDVSEKVETEMQLTELMEVEHRLLEQIFPRHVLEYIAMQNISAGQPGGAAGSSSAPGSRKQRRKSQFDLLKSQDCSQLAHHHEQITVLFCDVKGFTAMCSSVEPAVVMSFLNMLYTQFDSLLHLHDVYKVETIGDCYMVAGGLVRRGPDGVAALLEPGEVDSQHARKVVRFAKALLEAVREMCMPNGQPLQVRVGIHSGPAMSGVVGTKMPRFCLFGDTINTASRCESTCPPLGIHATTAVRDLVPEEPWVATGGVMAKGKGIMRTFLLGGNSGAVNPASPPPPLPAAAGATAAPAAAATTPSSPNPPSPRDVTVSDLCPSPGPPGHSGHHGTPGSGIASVVASGRMALKRLGSGLRRSNKSLAAVAAAAAAIGGGGGGGGSDASHAAGVGNPNASASSAEVAPAAGSSLVAATTNSAAGTTASTGVAGGAVVTHGSPSGAVHHAAVSAPGVAMVAGSLMSPAGVVAAAPAAAVVRVPSARLLPTGGDALGVAATPVVLPYVQGGELHRQVTHGPVEALPVDGAAATTAAGAENHTAAVGVSEALPVIVHATLAMAEASPVAAGNDGGNPYGGASAVTDAEGPVMFSSSAMLPGSGPLFEDAAQRIPPQAAYQYELESGPHDLG